MEQLSNVHLDDPYTLEQLRSPRMNVQIVRPLVDRLYELHDISVGKSLTVWCDVTFTDSPCPSVFCLLVNRFQFLREQTYRAHHQTVNTTRALLCELVANRILRRYDEDNPGEGGLLQLAKVMVAGFTPFQGAPIAISRQSSRAFDWMKQERGGYEKLLSALEIGIISESKSLLSSPASQKIIESIYKGRIVYTPSSFVDILPDHYKHKPIKLYNPRRAPLLNQYRLVVPRTRNYLEIAQFITLLVLYFLVMEKRDGIKLTGYEVAFCVYALGWTLDQLATMLEHGWHVYTLNLWSFLDATFTAIFSIYFVFRMRGIATETSWPSEQALDVLSIGAPVLVPRLAFNLMAENMLFISLREMVADFTVLTLLSVWCFAGFLLSLKWLGDGSHAPITISKWMLWVWFGLDGTGIQRSIDFHWLIGPTLMVTFAFLGNTLFLTILVSMLSNTFSNIVAHSNAEIQFRRAVQTFEGVKSDAIFAYQPPFNILALCILLPLKFVVSPRWFHKLNVTAVRVLNAPLLLILSAYERSYLWTDTTRRVCGTKTRNRLIHWGFHKFSVHGDIQAVFDSEPPIDEISDEDRINGDVLADEFPLRRKRTFTIPHSNVAHRSSTRSGNKKKRKESMDSIAGLAEHLPDLLHNCHSSSETQSRLDGLEAATSRIEEMLGRLCENFDDNGSETQADLTS